MKKYELTDETKILLDGTVLHRICAVKNFVLVDGTDVKTGDLGGWVEKEYNLLQDGEARVGGEAEVYGKAHVYGEAQVSGYALVRGVARIYSLTQVSG